jgi:hypothetical protein
MRIVVTIQNKNEQLSLKKKAEEVDMKRIMFFAVILAFVIFAGPRTAKTDPPGKSKPFDTVTVDNDNTNPIPVVNVSGAVQPFQGTLDVQIMYPSDRGHAELEIEEEGKQLVIEHVSASVYGAQGQQYMAWITCGAPYWLVLTHQITWESGGDAWDIFTANQPLRAYLPGSGKIHFEVLRKVPAPGELPVDSHLTISGYLVDLP